MSKLGPVVAPDRPPDYISKRGVAYYWSPEWVRGTNASNTTFGRIQPIKESGTVNLYMLSREGHRTFIQGSIQREFKRWHEERTIDWMLLGEDPRDIDDLILNEDW